MQVRVNFRNFVIAAVVIVGGCLAYRHFLGGIRTRDIGELLKAHRTAHTMKRATIHSRILALYRHDAHYATVLSALDHKSPVTREMAVAVLGERSERGALPRMLRMLDHGETDPAVVARLAGVFEKLRDSEAALEAVERLIELTDDHEPHDVRRAAHDALRAILVSGAQVKFGEGMRAHWTQIWRLHEKNPKER